MHRHVQVAVMEYQKRQEDDIVELGDSDDDIDEQVDV